METWNFKFNTIEYMGRTIKRVKKAIRKTLIPLKRQYHLLRIAPIVITQTALLNGKWVINVVTINPLFPM